MNNMKQFRIPKKEVLTLSILAVLMASSFMVVNTRAVVPGSLGHAWDSSLIKPLYYYVYNQWSEFPTAVSDWMNWGCDFGSITRTYSESAPLVVDTYSSSTDGSAGFTSYYPLSGSVTTMSIGLNNYYLTHGGDLGVGLPLDTANKRKSTCAHELGHVQNLAHVGDGSIMMTIAAGRLLVPIYTPQVDDKTGVNNLW